MAEIIANEGGGKKKGKRRAKKHSTNIDMTPMVDLMCLLLTFFILTAAFSKPKVMEIVLPDPPKKNDPAPPKIPGWRTVNIVLDENDKIYYYVGIADPTHPPIPILYETNYSKDGVRKILLNRNKSLFKKMEDLNVQVAKGKLNISRDSLTKRLRDLKSKDDVGPIVLIKATDKAKYKNVVNIIDEMAITNIARYAIVDINSFEKRLLAKKKRELGIK
jgi:biopolymer transport protein ExbD